MLTMNDAVNRIVGALLEKPEYKFTNRDLVADVVREAVSRYIDLELEYGYEE